MQKREALSDIYDLFSLVISTI